MIPSTTTVLLTGSGIGGGPDIIRSLRADEGLAARVVGVDSNPDQPSRHLCDAFHHVPSREQAGYVDRVAEIAAGEGASVIYPLPAFDQEIFGAAREELSRRGFAVPCCAEAPARTCNDKWLLYERVREFAPELVPETRAVHSAEELSDAVGALGYPGGPVCIRRRVSRGAMGFRVLDDSRARLAGLIEENPGSPGSLRLSLAELLDTLGKAERFPDYLVQEYLPGAEWDVDALCNEGEAVAVVTRRNLAMTGGGALRSVLEPHEEIAEASTRLISELGLNAVVNLSFRFDDGERLKLIEINPRVPSSVAAGLAGGVNLVALAVRQALGEAIAPIVPEWGGEFTLHFQSLVTDASGRPVAGAPPRDAADAARQP